ncbi:MAG: M20/M25/M40 family metallo-hydrolase, partial [Bacteroidales bacterium]|nr:M20/M25/M40 family metallo-hydrolase [Bacteroidales bacterium]
SGLSNEAWPVGIPVLRIKRNLADRILSAKGKTTAGLENEINTSHKTIGFATGVTIKAGSEVIVTKSNTRNVVMVLNGEDENLKDEYLIIGGHFDHLGMGGSSSRAGDTVAVHPGADDNASGVAGFIEIAEKFALTNPRNRRSIIFTGFSGEESGLLGSKYFTENPPVDLSKVNAMINLDMVGRLRDSGSLQVGGIGTSPILKELIVSLVDTNSINLALSEEGSGPSDHSAFYGKDIPVLFFTTGAHLDYHTPSDTWEKLNYQGMASVSDIIFNVAEELANDDNKLAFTEAGPKQEAVRTMRRQGVTLGIMPDFAGNIKNGLRADLVTPGKPAALGGMKKGDIITAINGKSINNIQDYMYRMGQLKHGETISVEILRNGKNEVLLIQL